VEEGVDRRGDDPCLDGQDLDADQRQAGKHVYDDTFVQYAVEDFCQA
jgi:hypothetical protein